MRGDNFHSEFSLPFTPTLINASLHFIPSSMFGTPNALFFFDLYSFANYRSQM